ncbi:MAG: hypothetical protein PHQ34_14410, partial [Methanothrix sp.]|nr:hypothetical protein [Methanothrix sp.]
MSELRAVCSEFKAKLLRNCSELIASLQQTSIKQACLFFGRLESLSLTLFLRQDLYLGLDFHLLQDVFPRQG